MGYYRGLIPRVTWLLVMGQNFGYDRFSLAAKGWGTVHPIPDMAASLMAEEEGPAT
jgi:hypothetical protein